MAQVIPAILASTKEEFVDMVTDVFSVVKMIQIDIMDGKFVPQKTWGGPDEVFGLELPVKFEVHLMVKNPENVVLDWARAGAHRIIFHLEAAKESGAVIEKIRGLGREVGIAINPETPIAELSPWIKMIDYVLVMGFTPGASGQKFQSRALTKIKEIKSISPNIKVGVDGGVNFETAPAIVAAGADVLTAASAIFEHPDPEEAIQILSRI